jgi:hypothetical protein
MPEQSVCSAIHGSLGDDDDAPIAGTVNGAGAMKAKPVASGQRAGVGAAARVEVKPSILRRAIDAWLGRRSAAGVGRTKGGEG